MRGDYMYYNKLIDVYQYGKHKNEYNETVKGYSKVLENIECDVQPYSAEKLEKQYGYKVECTKRIFCDIYDEIQESNIVVYRNKTYKIQKIIEWDDYLEIAILEYEVKLDG